MRLIILFITLLVVAPTSTMAQRGRLRDRIGDVSRPGEQIANARLWGYADLHAHQFARLGFGGQVLWGEEFTTDSRGIEAALPWGTPLHGPGGSLDVVGNLLTFMHRSPLDPTALLGHLVGGFPQFDGWPRWDSYTHQQMYVDWLKRAVDGGLRLMVMRSVNSETLCRSLNRNLLGELPAVDARVGPQDFTCEDMPAVRRQVEAAKELEKFVDEESGGVGKGWYRIVYTPAQARDVIASGKLAVVLGVEVAGLFGCRNRSSGCNAESVWRSLREYYDLGIRDYTPIHQVDNAFGGAALYNELFNSANLTANGEWFSVRECASQGYEFRFEIGVLTENLRDDALDFIEGLIGFRPWERPPPDLSDKTAHCNRLGLTPLGRSLLREMMAHKVIIDIDHMSRLAASNALGIAAQNDYPVIASHTGIQGVSRGPGSNHEGQKTDRQLQQIRNLGGLVAPILIQGGTRDVIPFSNESGVVIPNTCGHSSRSWVQAYLYTVDKMDGGPVALGSDFNGLAGLPAPRFADDRDGITCNNDRTAPQGQRVDYPIQIPGTNQTLPRSVVGQRTLDINVDGVAHVGMLPDFIADLKAMGLTDADLQPLFRSAEAYVTMWERIVDSTDVKSAFEGELVAELRPGTANGDRRTVTVVTREAETGAAVNAAVAIRGGDGRWVRGQSGTVLSYAACRTYDRELRRTMEAPCTGNATAPHYISATFETPSFDLPIRSRGGNRTTNQTRR